MNNILPAYFEGWREGDVALVTTRSGHRFYAMWTLVRSIGYYWQPLRGQQSTNAFSDPEQTAQLVVATQPQPPSFGDYSTGSTHPDCNGDTDLCPDSGCKACQGVDYDNRIRGRFTL